MGVDDAAHTDDLARSGCTSRRRPHFPERGKSDLGQWSGLTGAPVYLGLIKRRSSYWSFRAVNNTAGRGP